MDHVSAGTRHRAEQSARAAAAEAHASYYAHPSYHLHTYLSAHETPEYNGLSQPDGSVIQGMNGPASGENKLNADPTAPSFVPEEVRKEEDDKKKIGTSGTREEEGGKTDAGKPSGLDQGALEIGGEAGGTLTHPGPSAEVVERFHEQLKINGHGEANGHGVSGVEVPRPVIERFLSTSERMSPHLQLMCGPLISYYTVKDGIWQGAAMVVCADAGSVYTTDPSLQLKFQPYTPALVPSPTELLQSRTVSSQKIFTYTSVQGSFSFFRFMMEIPLQQVEMDVRYRLNGGAEMGFVVPAIGQNMRWAAHSCNGFSSGVNPDDFKGKYESGYDPVWEDLLLKHHEKPYHALVGGGDQIYCDAITREPELQSWINAPNREKKLGHPLTDEMKLAVDRFYFNHYCKIFRSNAFGRANSSIPMVNMLDDHDLIDGFGTYDDETQAAPVLSYIGGRGYFWFLLFQLFVVDAVDGTNPAPGSHLLKSMIIGDKRGPWIPFPSHSLLVYLGPKVTLLAIDCRAERRLGRIVTPETYTKVFGEVRKVKGIEQLVILLGVPIAYPRMSFLEHFLDLKWNPINILARHNAMGLGGQVNKFNQASELLDDLNDHWCANVHKKERNWLVLECQHLALEMHVRITFLSGDVHLAAVGCLYTKKRRGEKEIKAENDHRYMLNIVTSAIVNTPPPAGAAMMVAILGGHKHRTLHADHTDEKMIPLFDRDTDGSLLKRKLVQPRRNYASIEYQPTGELVFDFRVEKSPGEGQTIGYPIKVPPARWEGPA